MIALGVFAPLAEGETSTFETGFMDLGAMGGADRDVWAGRGASVGATRVRLGLNWRSVVRRAPAPSEAESAAWDGYDFTNVDAQVRAAVGHGLVPMLTLNGAPNWAEAPGRPKSAKPGTWKPDAGAFGSFAHAVASRYSGTFPDPLVAGKTLPRVRQFQMWNEPNLNLYLAPQYENKQPFAPGRFRALVNSGADGVRRAQPDATVIAGGLAPFGDPGTAPARTRPVTFLRGMLCVPDGVNVPCNERTNVDAFALHPYAVDRPSRSATDPNDATVPNVDRLNTVIGIASKLGTVASKPPPVWITEFSYDSSPPDPQGVPAATRARWISESFWRFWKAGVPVAFWFLMQDQAPTPSYAATYQSGVFLRNGRRKSDARAFRFPLLVTGKGKRVMNVWFRTPVAGKVSIQTLRRGKWMTVVRKKGLPANGVATVKVPRAGVRAVRGIAGKATSYAWNVP